MLDGRGRRPDGQRASPPSPRRRSACRSGSLPDEDGGCPSRSSRRSAGGWTPSTRSFPRRTSLKVAGPEGVVPMSSDALAGRVPGHPRTAPTLTDGCSGDRPSPKHPSVVQRWAAAGGGVGGWWPMRRRRRAVRRRWSTSLGVDRAPTVTRRWSVSGRTRNGVPGATPMPWAARATTAARSSSTRHPHVDAIGACDVDATLDEHPRHDAAVARRRSSRARRSVALVSG